MPRVVEPLRYVAIHCERAIGLRCANPLLQSACLHVLLVFNGPPVARLSGAWRRPCHVVPWKIRVPPDEDHDGQVISGYLFTLIAHSL
jgi:hypothetical protein